PTAVEVVLPHNCHVGSTRRNQRLLQNDERKFETRKLFENFLSLLIGSGKEHAKSVRVRPFHQNRIVQIVRIVSVEQQPEPALAEVIAESRYDSSHPLAREEVALARDDEHSDRPAARKPERACMEIRAIAESVDCILYAVNGALANEVQAPICDV